MNSKTQFNSNKKKIKEKTLHSTERFWNYPHFWKREELLGFSNWITPSNGTSFPLTKTVSSLAKGAEVVEPVVVEPESTPPSALASVIWKGFRWVVLVLNLGLRLEKSVGFAFTNFAGDEMEHLADSAPPGAWLTSIILSQITMTPPCLPHKPTPHQQPHFYPWFFWAITWSLLFIYLFIFVIIFLKKSSNYNIFIF